MQLSFSVYISLQSAEPPILFGPDVFPSILFLFSNILSPCFSLHVKDKGSHQYQTTGKI